MVAKEIWALIGEGLHIIFDVYDGDEPNHALAKAKRRLERRCSPSAKPCGDMKAGALEDFMKKLPSTGGLDADKK